MIQLVYSTKIHRVLVLCYILPVLAMLSRLHCSFASDQLSGLGLAFLFVHIHEASFQNVEEFSDSFVHLSDISWKHTR